MFLTEQEIGRIGTVETQLMDLVNRMDRMAENRTAGHLRLSRLKEYNRAHHHLKMTASYWEALIQGGGGGLYRMSNDDMIFVGPTDRANDMAEVVQRIQKLFANDPALIADNPKDSDFIHWYDLRKSYSDFRALAERLQTVANQRREVESKRLTAARNADIRTEPKDAMDPQRLAGLLQTLRNMNVGPLLRWQPICAVTSAQEKPQGVFTEYFIRIDELADKLVPDINLLGDRWLFQYLSAFLDKKLLSVLPDSPEMKDPNQAISININVATLLSDEFIDFDNKFRTISKKPIVLEIQPHDIFSDMNGYAFARDFCRDRGYKICLDGLNHLTFPLLNRAFLKADLLKIFWTPDLADEAQGPRRTQFEEAIKRAGASRIILCHCDTREALEFGRGLGLSLFQGNALDKILDKKAGTAAVEEAKEPAPKASKRSYRHEHSAFEAERKALEAQVKKT